MLKLLMHQVSSQVLLNKRHGSFVDELSILLRHSPYHCVSKILLNLNHSHSDLKKFFPLGYASKPGLNFYRTLNAGLSENALVHFVEEFFWGFTSDLLL